VRLFKELQRRLFRWRSDGSDPIRLGHRRIFILPTRAGLLYVVALLAMLTGAINYSLALGHALVFLLAGLGLAWMHHTFRNLYGLTITPGRCAPVFAGETARFPLFLADDRNVARLALELRTDDGTLAVPLSLAARAGGEVAVPVPAPVRGWLDLPRIRLSTEYPLGQFVAWSYLMPAMRCLVYPRPLASDLPDPQAATTAGERQGEGGQEDFSGFRDRQPADSPRHVAWKASARDGGERPLLVKQFAGGAQEELMLDWELTPSGMSAETRISIMAGWVLAAEEIGSSYGLRIPGRELRPACGDAHCRNCLEALALMPA
jgi:uncharacterized protein (DUF58 family)